MKKLFIITIILFYSFKSFSQGAFQSDGRFAPTGNYFITKFGEAQTGFWPIARYTQRDSIPQWQLTQGMIVYAADRDSCYQLTSVLLRTWYSFKLGSAGDLTNYYTKTQADSRYLQSYTETDPTIYTWAKQATKPSYTYAEITGTVPTFNQNTTGSAATLGTSRYIYGNLFNGSADITSTISDTYIASADNWNTAYTNRIATANSPLSISSNTLSIAQAGTSTDGFLSATDWNTFNSKQNALGYTAENNANKGVNNGYASLDGSGKVPTSQLPNLAMNNVWTVASQSAMLALSTAVVGDVAIRSDSSLSYVLKSADYTKPYNWVQLLFPTAPVQSVNGQTGSISLTTSNISEGSNLYYTDARARAALSFSSGTAGYNSTTGVISIPTNNNQLTNGGGYISNITGLLTAGSNTSLSGSGTSGSPYIVNIPQSVATTASPTFAGLTSGDLVIGSRAAPFVYLSGTSMGTAQCIFINQNSLKIGWGADSYRSGIENAGEGGGIAGMIIRTYNGSIDLRDQNDSAATIKKGIWNGSAIADTYISSASTWNSKQGAITLTTTGSSGAATFSGNTLNIPTYTLAGLGGISGNQTITLGGILSGSGTTSITASAASGYYMPTTTDQSNWNGKQAALSGTGFVKISGTTISYDNSTYLTTSAAASTYQPLENQRLSTTNSPTFANGTYTGALNGTSATFTGDIQEKQDNGNFVLTRANGTYGSRWHQNVSVGSISFQIKLLDNTTWQDFLYIGEGNTASTANLYIQPTNGTTYIGSSDAFYVAPSGALNGTSASFSSSVTASSFIKSGGTSSQYLMADGSTSTIGTISSGTFTPSFSSASNCTVSAGSYSQYMRVGSTVTVSGSISINVSNTSPTSFYMTIPVESNFSSTGDGGIASGSIHKDTGSTSGSIQADTSGNNNKVFVQLIGGTADNHTYYYHYTYTIQ